MSIFLPLTVKIRQNTGKFYTILYNSIQFYTTLLIRRLQPASMACGVAGKGDIGRTAARGLLTRGHEGPAMRTTRHGGRYPVDSVGGWVRILDNSRRSVSPPSDAHGDATAAWQMCFVW